MNTHSAKNLLLFAVAILLCSLLCVTVTGCSNSTQPSDQGTVAETDASKNSNSEPETNQNKQGRGQSTNALEGIQDKKGPCSEDDYANLKGKTKKIIKKYGTNTAVTFVDLSTGYGFSINGSNPKVSASIIKLAVLSEFCHQVKAGTLSKSSSYTLEQKDIVGGSGILGSKGAGYSTTLGEIALLMICQSDNTATNILIDTLGKKNINEEIERQELGSTKLNRKMLSGGKENYTSTNDVAKILSAIYYERFYSKSLSKFALKALKKQAWYNNESLRAGIPKSVVVAHKTGTLDGIENDAAIVYAEKPYALVIMNEDISQQTAFSLMKDISSCIYKHFGDTQA